MRPIIRNIKSYKTSRDYDRLWELAKESSIACVVDYERAGDCRDIAQTIRSGNVTHVSVRGSAYVWADSLEDFKKECAACNLEFLIPNVEERPETLAVFGAEYPILAELKEGWYLVAHPNGAAIAPAQFNFLASPAHPHGDLPEEIRMEAVWALMRWAAQQATWPVRKEGVEEATFSELEAIRED